MEGAGSYRVLFLIISYYGAILGTMPVIKTKTNSLVLLGLVSSSPGRQELFNRFWVAKSMSLWEKEIGFSALNIFLKFHYNKLYHKLLITSLCICRSLVSDLLKWELLDFCWAFSFALATNL